MSDTEPMLRVVRGTPTPEELAAVVTVLVARSRSVAPPAAPRSAWVEYSRPGAFRGRLPARRGGRAWRASALPR